MQQNRTFPPVFVIFAAGGGFLFMLGGVVTAMSASSRTTMSVAAASFVILAVYVQRLLKRLNTEAERVDELESTVGQLRASDAGLRSRMTSTLRAPLASIVGFTDRLIEDPAMDLAEREQLLTEVRKDAREVETILANLATHSPETIAMPDERAEGLVLLDEEARSIASTTPPGIKFETDLEPTKAWADSATVRQILRAVIAAARRNGTQSIVVKTHQLAKTATLTIASEGTLLGLDAVAALTGNVTEDDASSEAYMSLRDAHEAAAAMGAIIGYVETFGHAHVVIEFAAAPEVLELQALTTRTRPQATAQVDPRNSTPDLSFSAVAGLRPERPSASIRTV